MTRPNYKTCKKNVKRFLGSTVACRVTALSKVVKLRGITEIGDWVLVRIVISNLKLMVSTVEQTEK